MGLSSYVDGWDRATLALSGNDYAGDDLVDLRVGEPRRPRSTGQPARSPPRRGSAIGYDALVLATGSYPFVPPIPGTISTRCFVYRTLEDLDAIRAAAERPGPGRSASSSVVVCWAWRRPTRCGCWA